MRAPCTAVQGDFIRNLPKPATTSAVNINACTGEQDTSTTIYQAAHRPQRKNAERAVSSLWNVRLAQRPRGHLSPRRRCPDCLCESTPMGWESTSYSSYSPYTVAPLRHCTFYMRDIRTGTGAHSVPQRHTCQHGRQLLCARAHLYFLSPTRVPSAGSQVHHANVARSMPAEALV